jgi:ElaB/YqjD/DUF883 family membrane-anchored ribosome-binding protein
MASQDWEQESGGPTTAVKDKGRELVTDAQQQVQEKAAEVRSEAATRLREQVNRQSTTAGDQLHALGKALRRSSGELRSEGKGAPATVVEQAGQRAETLGGYLRDADADRILHDVESFARQRPWLTGAAGVLAGFLASRFVKASSQRRYETFAYSEYPARRGVGRELVAGDVR